MLLVNLASKNKQQCGSLCRLYYSITACLARLSCLQLTKLSAMGHCARREAPYHEAHASPPALDREASPSSSWVAKI